MKISRIGWTLWALVPVGVIAYHYGPGQAAYHTDLAAALVVRAQAAQEDAMELQQVAYAAHLEAISARGWCKCRNRAESREERRTRA